MGSSTNPGAPKEIISAVDNSADPLMVDSLDRSNQYSQLPAWGTLDVDSNGNLFIGGVNLNTNRIWCDRSTNAKNGGVTPTFDQSTAVNLGGNIVFGEPINPEGLVGQVFLAVDRSGTITNNNVYMLASVQPTGFTTGSDVMFVRSADGGLSFSAPDRINDDPVNPAKWHWFGTLSVAPNGRIDAVWLDTRNAANNTDSQLFYSWSTDGGTTWSPNVAISNSFNPFEGYPQQNKIGDYITIVSDNAGGNVAYAATFNFNPNTGQHEEDVYYVRVSPHPAFFNGEIALGGGWLLSQFPNGTPFGYYSYLPDQHFIYHIDLGFEYLFDANDANHGIYFYDFASSSFFYTSPSLLSLISTTSASTRGFTTFRTPLIRAATPKPEMVLQLRDRPVDNTVGN